MGLADRLSSRDAVWALWGELFCSCQPVQLSPLSLGQPKLHGERLAARGWWRRSRGWQLEVTKTVPSWWPLVMVSWEQLQRSKTTEYQRIPNCRYCRCWSFRRDHRSRLRFPLPLWGARIPTFAWLVSSVFSNGHRRSFKSLFTGLELSRGGTRIFLLVSVS